jgi:hypothetical protein
MRHTANYALNHSTWLSFRNSAEVIRPAADIGRHPLLSQVLVLKGSLAAHP